MMEAGISLMQLAKTSAKLAQLGKSGVPYISLCMTQHLVELQHLFQCLEI